MKLHACCVCCVNSRRQTRVKRFLAEESWFFRIKSMLTCHVCTVLAVLLVLHECAVSLVYMHVEEKSQNHQHRLNMAAALCMQQTDKQSTEPLFEKCWCWWICSVAHEQRFKAVHSCTHSHLSAPSSARKHSATHEEKCKLQSVSCNWRIYLSSEDCYWRRN